MILSGAARMAGVMGWPISHSRSPKLHGFWLDQYKIDGAYLPLPVAPAHFRDALRILPRIGFAGVNITAPHKEAALAAVDRLEPAAKRIGAVNTVIAAADGTLTGTNTDAHGFMANLESGCPGFRATAGPAVVLGAGGAARAICVALLDAGVPEIRLLNQSADRAERLAHEFGGPIRTFGWERRAELLADAALLVNTTTLGMKGQPPLALSLDRLPNAAVVNDIVYVPLETPLLKAARARGNPAVDGLGMLIHQASIGFAAWFGVAPEASLALRAFLVADLIKAGQT